MNVLERVDAAATPVFSMARNEAALGATEFAWTVDGWPTPAGAIGYTDNYDVQSGEIQDNTSSRRKMGNYGQAFRRAYGVGWIQDAVPKMPGTGKGGELARAAADNLVVLKQEIEAAFCSTDQAAAQDDGSDGGTMAGLGKLTDRTNTYTGATGFAYGKVPNIYAAPTACSVTGTLASNFDLATLRSVLKALRGVTKKSRDYTFLCGLNLREAVSKLTEPVSATTASWNPTRTFMQSIDDNELGISIDVVRTDYGRLLVVPTDWIGTTTLTSAGATTATRSARAFIEDQNRGYVLAKEKLAKRWGAAPERKELPDNGGGAKEHVRAHCSLVYYTPHVSAQFKYTS